MSGYFFSIFLSTFVLEDVALATSIGLVSSGKLDFATAFMACFLGIAIGDLGLYFAGYLASKFEIENYFVFLKKYRKPLLRAKRSQIFTYSIVISRAIPGTRLPTYLSAGYLRYSFLRFTGLTIVSVAIWVVAALFAGKSLSSIFMDHWIPTVLAFLLGLQLLKSLFPKLLNFWDRKALMHSWRKWTHFEFWPAWFFYLPIVPRYIYLSIKHGKHGSFLTPFYASPGLAHGGLIGESKWDFLKHLSAQHPSTLKSLKIGSALSFMEVRKIIEEQQIGYPFIMKPDVGQRGFGVRIIRNDFDLTEYLLLSDFDKIIQKLSLLPMEAGLFYIRNPSELVGSIFSVTDKKFPFVTGDGKTRLGNLILRDKRARIIAPVYFERHRSRLDSIIENGKVFFLADCGNHCQGAVFLNGAALATDDLTKKLDLVAKQIPDFYFGRFDVRYRDQDSLKKGEHFEIVEVNGSGSEATHIWDANTKLIDAYQTLYIQWALLFEIGSEVRKSSTKLYRIDILSFLKECFRVIFRKESLSISS
jgi:membrane protein DedA with SNARE-associated domain